MGYLVHAAGIAERRGIAWAFRAVTEQSYDCITREGVLDMIRGAICTPL